FNFVFCFFFQAEDGIRDRNVTVVQTCALPILMALENGGDDFITKPFHSQVVLAKIRSQLRRAYGEYAVISEERKEETNGLILYRSEERRVGKECSSRWRA